MCLVALRCILFSLSMALEHCGTNTQTSANNSEFMHYDKILPLLSLNLLFVCNEHDNLKYNFVRKFHAKERHSLST